RTVRELGGDVAVTRSFADHHFYSADEARDLMQDADRDGLVLVTTAKDAIRLAHGSQALEELHHRAKMVEIEVAFETDVTPGAVIDQTLKAWRRRRLEG
ncbi:tetraacyldisaccharide 4'-kinase, partial [Mesorhizobium sp. YIM 152430]